MSQEEEKIDIAFGSRDDRNMDEIIGYVPSWILRWGILIIFLTLLTLLAGSWFFKYPDIVVAPISITSINPPASIIGSANGKIDKIFVNNNQDVEEGDLLAVIKSSATYEDVIALKKTLKKYTNTTNIPTQKLHLLKNPKLGILQTAYSVFVKSHEEYVNFLDLDYHAKKSEATDKQLQKLNAYAVRLYNQKNILERDFRIAQLQYTRDSNLYSTKVLSDFEFEKSESSFLQRKNMYEGLKASLSNLEIQKAQMDQSVLELELQHLEQKNRLELAFKDALENLNNSIATWEQTYVLVSPIEGKVTFNNYWSINQNIKMGDIVFTVVPDSVSPTIGRLLLPILGSGKVQIGQKVNIKLNNFPHTRYGIVKGIIKNISLVPSNNTYAVEVVLPNGLISNYNKRLPFSQEMQGQADIVTDDVRLLERIIQPLQVIFK